MLALRTARGVVFEEYKKNFGGDFLSEYASETEKVRQYVEVNEKRMKIADEFLFVQNSIIIEFFNAG